MHRKCVYCVVLSNEIKTYSVHVGINSNVCYAEKVTKQSSNTLLRLVTFSAKQTLYAQIFVYLITVEKILSK